MTREAELEGDVAQIANVVRDDFRAMKIQCCTKRKNSKLVLSRLASFCIPFNKN